MIHLKLQDNARFCKELSICFAEDVWFLDVLQNSCRYFMKCMQLINFDLAWLNTSIGEVVQTKIRGKSILIHPEYQHKERINDIAMLFLEQPVEYTEHIQPICLPSSKHRSFHILFACKQTIFQNHETYGRIQMLRKRNW